MPPPKPRGETIKTFSFVPRLGVQVGGGGSVDGECAGSLCATATSVSHDYDLSSAFAISFDFLFKAGKLVRLGPGLMYTHTMDIQYSGSSVHTELGNLTDIDAVLELIPQVGPSVWLVPRFQLGLTSFNASGTAETGEKEDKASCLASSSSVTFSGCDSIDSPHIGYNIGTGFGVLIGTGSAVRFRIDTLLNYYSFGVEEGSATDSYGATATFKTSLSGTRYLLLAGLEI